MTKPKKQKSPQHLGLIIDGNRRWARKQGLSTLEGHRAGYENIKTITRAAWDKGVKTLSAYVFSTENWNRSKDEVDYLMDLVLWVVKSDLRELEKEGAKIRVIGSREGLSPKIIKAIDSAETRTKNNKKGTLVLCFNYGGHREISDAMKSVVNAKIPVDDIDEQLVAKHIYEPDIPPIDLIIRTSGEQRLSNFMLWRAAYSELYFSDKYWPDFSEKDLDNAFDDYANRQRRFGK